MTSDQSQTAKSDGLRLRARLRYLYHGSQPAAVKFRLMVIVIDLIIIGFFLATPILKEAGWAFYVLDYLIAAVLGLDLAARAYAYSDIRSWLKRPIVWVDLFVLATLLFPAWLANLGFLRLLRFWSLEQRPVLAHHRPPLRRHAGRGGHARLDRPGHLRLCDHRLRLRLLPG